MHVTTVCHVTTVSHPSCPSNWLWHRHESKARPMSGTSEEMLDLNLNAGALALLAVTFTPQSKAYLGMGPTQRQTARTQRSKTRS